MNRLPQPFDEPPGFRVRFCEDSAQYAAGARGGVFLRRERVGDFLDRHAGRLGLTDPAVRAAWLAERGLSEDDWPPLIAVDPIPGVHEQIEVIVNPRQVRRVDDNDNRNAN